MQVEWIIVFGSGGHANVAREGILTRSRGRVLILDDPAAAGRTVLTTFISAARDRLINNMPGAPVAFSIGKYCGFARRRSMSRPACDCAETRVGAHTRPGVGSAVPPGIRVAADVHAGAASALVCDIPDGVVVGDCPAPRFKQAGDPG